MCNNSEISLVVFVTTNHAITYTNNRDKHYRSKEKHFVSRKCSLKTMLKNKLITKPLKTNPLNYFLKFDLQTADKHHYHSFLFFVILHPRCANAR